MQPQAAPFPPCPNPFFWTVENLRASFQSTTPEKLKEWLNSSDQNGLSPLAKIVDLGVAKLAEIAFLFQSGANPNIFNRNGVTPLHFAINQRAHALVSLLLSAKADPYLVEDPLDRTPLTVAFDKMINDDHEVEETSGCLEKLVEELLRNKIPKSAPYFESLVSGLSRVDIRVANVVAELKIARVKQVQTRAILTTLEQFFPGVQDANPQCIPPTAPIHTPLTLLVQSVVQSLYDDALRKSNEDAIKKSYLEQQKDRFGRTVAHYCVQYGLNNLLLELNQIRPIDEPDNLGNRPLFCATFFGSPLTVMKLIPISNLRAKNNLGYTSLHAAVINRKITAVGLLLNADPTSWTEKDNQGWAPLHHAAAKNYTQFIYLFLVGYRVDPNLPTTDGKTPLNLGQHHLGFKDCYEKAIRDIPPLES